MKETVLSIDIGLRNLALCIVEGERSDTRNYIIHLWKNYDTLDQDSYTCQSLQKNKKVCNKKCLYKYANDELGTTYCCKVHFPKNLLPMQKKNNFKRKAVKDYLYQDIAKAVILALNKIVEVNKEIFDKVTKVVIELQPTFNPKMKFVSHVVYGKLTEIFMSRPKVCIRFMSARKKFKAYKGPKVVCTLKGAYARRKKQSIEYTKWLLENKFSEQQCELWLPDLLNCGKMDDRADILLQAVTALT
jgi:hypothetical protein